MKPSPLSTLTVIAFVLAPGLARADEVLGTRSEDVVEKDHEIHLKLGRGQAELRVRRTVWNGHTRHDQAVFRIDLPDQAVAIGMRTLGELDRRPHWFEAELLEAELASARYAELTGLGVHRPKDPALLSWLGLGSLALQVFPVAPRTDKTIEYTLIVPMGWEHGRWNLELPRLGTATKIARLRVEPAHRGDRILLGPAELPSDAELVASGGLDLALVPATPPDSFARLGEVRIDDRTTLVRYQVAITPELGRIPSDARVVLVLDASRSVAEDAARAQAAAARAYLHHFARPELAARVAVITFDRDARRMHDDWVDPSTAIAALAKAAVRRRNGSDVERALRLAAVVFGEGGGGGPRRLVLLTDALTRRSLGQSRIADAVRDTGALVHVVEVGDTIASLDRDPGHVWLAAVERSGGTAWLGGAATRTDDIAGQIGVYEELARPVRLHEVVAEGLPGEIEVPSELVEGGGWVGSFLAPRPLARVRLSGRLWSRTVELSAEADAEAGRRAAALVFGTPLMDELDPAQQWVLARHGRVVSPVTSLLAIEPGVRPSTEGLTEHEGIGLGGIGMGGGSGRGRIDHGSVDHEAWLREAVAAARGACRISETVSVVLETTRAELVDVAMEPGAGPEGACLRERLWALELPAAFGGSAWRAFRVTG